MENTIVLKESFNEVYEILMQIPKDELDKIPEDVINEIKNNRDENYIWNYDETKDFNEQKINKYTLGILTNLMLKYVLEKEEAEEAIKEFKENDIKLEEEKLEKYPIDVFKNREIKKENKPIEEAKNNTELIEYNRKNGFFKKIILLINKLIGREK